MTLALFNLPAADGNVLVIVFVLTQLFFTWSFVKKKLRKEKKKQTYCRIILDKVQLFFLLVISLFI